ncbi:FRG domain-containing protein [Chishuiella sp.]|uniref:FRG domain-containing protein n=1 Tax=Chishuiella sp. TaxID=1969467 RepID=UPI0028ABA732|nr:FRG domain-containing protein [Chishuiella sp.]
MIVNSVSEYIQEIKNISSKLLGDDNHDLWFRAENEFFKTKLIPSIFREKDFFGEELSKSNIYESKVITPEGCNIASKIENTLRSKFSINNHIYNKNKYSSDSWENYYLMQHYGIPTRLLDWSESALIALFFCVEKLNSEYNGIIWILNPYKLNELSFLDFQSLNSKHKDNLYSVHTPQRNKKKSTPNGILTNYLDFKFDDNNNFNFPIAITPTRFDLRMKYQKSNFTIFGNIVNGLLANPSNNDFLDKIIINKDKIEEIKDELYVLGITNESIYPGLEGVAKDVMYETRKIVKKEL